MKAPEKPMRIVYDLEGRAYYVPEKAVSRKVRRAKATHHRHHEWGMLPPPPAPEWMAHEHPAPMPHSEAHIIQLTRKVPQVRHRVRHAG
ncbi:hypothetical protein [uncultured Acetobacteroides sp.]|uniref:hypothetical protein n=1 Tax=uncultured Acetobacteroides sp. TaxID=1760811 RepID=UPI0029F4BAF3|nr:hypothetical protein [uncultured Acetobacteroides sp.]